VTFVESHDTSDLDRIGVGELEIHSVLVCVSLLSSETDLTSIYDMCHHARSNGLQCVYLCTHADSLGLATSSQDVRSSPQFASIRKGLGTEQLVVVPPEEPRVVIDGLVAFGDMVRRDYESEKNSITGDDNDYYFVLQPDLEGRKSADIESL